MDASETLPRHTFRRPPDYSLLRIRPAARGPSPLRPLSRRAPGSQPALLALEVKELIGHLLHLRRGCNGGARNSLLAQAASVQQRRTLEAVMGSAPRCEPSLFPSMPTSRRSNAPNTHSALQTRDDPTCNTPGRHRRGLARPSHSWGGGRRCSTCGRRRSFGRRAADPRRGAPTPRPAREAPPGAPGRHWTRPAHLLISASTGLRHRSFNAKACLLTLARPWCGPRLRRAARRPRAPRQRRATARSPLRACERTRAGTAAARWWCRCELRWKRCGRGT